MKKFSLFLSLLLVCLLGLTGCGKSNAQAAETQDQTTVDSTLVSETTDTESTTIPIETESESTLAEQVTEDSSLPDLSGHSLMIYCGAGMTNPFTDIANNFIDQTGCEVNVTYANAGQIQSQISISGEGDFFIAGSAEELEPVKDFVTSQKNLVKHIPVLAVAEGNPLNITSLSEAVNSGASMVIGDTEATPIGKITKKALTNMNLYDSANIIATTTTCPEMITALTRNEADCAVVWKENCEVDGVEIVDTDELDDFIKVVPSALLTSCSDQQAANAFSDYLNSEEVHSIWTSYGYEISE